MNKIILIAVLVAVASAIKSKSHQDNSAVIEITDSNFDQIIADNAYVLVDFSTPWW